MMGLCRRTSRSRKIATRDLTIFFSKLKGRRCHEWAGRSTRSRSGLWIGTWTTTNGNAGRGLKGGEYIFSGCRLEGLKLACQQLIEMEKKLENLVGGSDGGNTLRKYRKAPTLTRRITPALSACRVVLLHYCRPEFG